MIDNMDSIRCSTVQVTASDICEIDNDKIIIAVPKNEATKIILAHGYQANRPLIQIAIAAVLLSLGYFAGIHPITNYIINLIGNPEAAIRPTVYTIFMALIWTPIGIYLVIDALKQRYYLLVETDTNKQKIVFQDKISKNEVYNFVNSIRDQFRYSIRSELHIT